MRTSIMRAFPDRQRAALLSLARVIFGVESIDDRRVHEVVADVDAHLAATSPFLRTSLVLLFDVLRVLPLLVLKRAIYIESLNDAERAAFLDRLERSPRLSIVLVPFKTLFTISFYEQPGELETIGYVGARRRYLLGGTSPS